MISTPSKTREQDGTRECCGGAKEESEEMVIGESLELEDIEITSGLDTTTPFARAIVLVKVDACGMSSDGARRLRLGLVPLADGPGRSDGSFCGPILFWLGPLLGCDWDLNAASKA